MPARICRQPSLIEFQCGLPPIKRKTILFVRILLYIAENPHSIVHN